MSEIIYEKFNYKGWKLVLYNTLECLTPRWFVKTPLDTGFRIWENFQKEELFRAIDKLEEYNIQDPQKLVNGFLEILITGDISDSLKNYANLRWSIN